MIYTLHLLTYFLSCMQASHKISVRLETFFASPVQFRLAQSNHIESKYI